MPQKAEPHAEEAAQRPSRSTKDGNATSLSIRYCVDERLIPAAPRDRKRLVMRGVAESC
jgi:hypothetical protein